MRTRAPSSTLFPYTTLFRSGHQILDVLRDGAIVAKGEPGRDRADGLEFVTVDGFVSVDDDVVDAELIDEAHHLLLSAGGDGEHGDHGADAEDHAEHGQQAAQLVREEAGHPHFQFGKNVPKHMSISLPAWSSWGCHRISSRSYPSWRSCRRLW